MPNTSNALRAAPCAAILSIVLAVPALAQGTNDQRTACMSDAMRLCASEIPDVDRITVCMTRKRASASPACQAAMGPSSGSTVEVASTGSVRRRVAP